MMERSRKYHPLMLESGQNTSKLCIISRLLSSLIHISFKKFTINHALRIMFGNCFQLTSKKLGWNIRKPKVKCLHNFGNPGHVLHVSTETFRSAPMLETPSVAPVNGRRGMIRHPRYFRRILVRLGVWGHTLVWRPKFMQVIFIILF